MREKLTLWQRSVLAIMYAVERGYEVEDVHSISRSAVQFSRRSLEGLLEFDWQGYHTRAMKELQEQDWVTIRLVYGRVAGYVLTDDASVHLWQKHVHAVSRTARLTEEMLRMPF